MMANNWKLATKIYDELIKNGAKLDNSSLGDVYIIERVLNEAENIKEKTEVARNLFVIAKVE